MRLLGLTDIAAYVGLKRSTINVYRGTGKLPTPDMVVSGKPMWYETTIDQWNQTRPKRRNT